MKFNFVHAERVGISHSILLKHMEVLLIAEMTKLHVVYVFLAVGTQARSTSLEPKLGHLLEAFPSLFRS